jgi:hypothetical protein
VDGGLRLSPAFGSDGLAFVLSAGQALASRDRGLTWDDAGVAPDQWVQDVRFSPTFASDNTIFATARLDPSADDSATSYGVLMSTDAAATWFQSSDGMSVDGVPYLSAVDLIVSPTYAQDQTLYVAAFGPRTEATEGRFSTWPWALFQSVDRGVSWQAVTIRAGYPDRDPRATLALSPAFAQDGRVLLTEVGGLLSRRPSGCTAQLSSDGGSTWTPVDPRWLDRYWSCGTPRLLGLPDQLVGAFQDGGEGGTGWNVWVETAAGPEWFRLPRQVTARPSAAADGTVFLGTSSGGIWARGPGARSTPGSLTCPIEPVLGFGRVYAADAWARDVLGCALDAELRIGIHQSISKGKPAYMLDDDLARWYVLYDDRWEIFQTQYSPFPTADERVYSGPVQHFEGGVMVYTTEPNSQHQILVLAGVTAGRSWRAWPEPPR